MSTELQPFPENEISEIVFTEYVFNNIERRYPLKATDKADRGLADSPNTFYLLRRICVLDQQLLFISKLNWPSECLEFCVQNVCVELCAYVEVSVSVCVCVCVNPIRLPGPSPCWRLLGGNLDRLGFRGLCLNHVVPFHFLFEVPCRFDFLPTKGKRSCCQSSNDEENWSLAWKLGQAVVSPPALRTDPGWVCTFAL